jgi:hypothetical protein
VALEIAEAMRNASLILDVESNSGSITNYLGMMGPSFSLNQVSSIEFSRQWISRMQIRRTLLRWKQSE